MIFWKYNMKYIKYQISITDFKINFQYLGMRRISNWSLFFKKTVQFSYNKKLKNTYEKYLFENII